jgi:hypothetical protein
MELRACMCSVAIPVQAVKKKKLYVMDFDSYQAFTGIGCFGVILDD